MFARAFRMAVRFTRPVVILRRRFDGTIECGCGACVVVNDEGWVATADHLFRSQDESVRHAGEIADHYRRIRRHASGTMAARRAPKTIGSFAVCSTPAALPTYANRFPQRSP